MKNSFGIILIVLLTGSIIGGMVWYKNQGKVKDIPGSFEYEDLTKWREVDPKLVTFEEKDPIKTGFSSLHAIHIDSKGNVYAAGNSGIKQFDPSGVLANEWKTESSARCVAVDNNGTLYVGLMTKILKFEGNKVAASWGNKGSGQGEFMHITAVALAEGNLFVADAGNRCVHRYALTGDFINDIGRKDTEEGEPGLIIRNPHLDILPASEGRIYIVNPGIHKIVTYTFNGDKIESWGKYGLEIEGFSGCCNPTNIAGTSNGSFITSEKNIPRIKIYDSKGVFQEVVAPPSAFDEKCAGMDLAVDKDGRVYAADPVQKTIRIFVRKKER
ncbi:hypothetical protein ACFL6F_04085 [Planctomycetota bacterium]